MLKNLGSSSGFRVTYTVIKLFLIIAIPAAFVGGNMDTRSVFSQPQACDSGIPGNMDGDDIPDAWERSGIDLNGDGKRDLNLAIRGASPWHKDIFLEVDYMELHQPYSQVIPNVLQAFNTAPVCNPDGRQWD